jgi:hypothetical protein
VNVHPDVTYPIQSASFGQIASRLGREDAGMTTVEYAVGTVAAASFAGLLIKLLMSDEARNLIWGVLSNAISAIFG